MIHKQVYIVRHCESDANKGGINLGENAELTEKGLAQALQLGKNISTLGPIDLLIASPIKTAVQTANIISNVINLPFEINPLFTQRRRPSSLLGKKHTDSAAKQISDSLFWGSEDINYRYSDEENLSDMKQRINQALDYLLSHEAKKICLVTHGTVLWGIFWSIFSAGEFSGKDFQKVLLSLEIDNNSITQIRYEDTGVFLPSGYTSKWKIVTWNSIGPLVI